MGITKLCFSGIVSIDWAAALWVYHSADLLMGMDIFSLLIPWDLINPESTDGNEYFRLTDVLKNTQ